MILSYKCTKMLNHFNNRFHRISNENLTHTLHIPIDEIIVWVKVLASVYPVVSVLPKINNGKMEMELINVHRM